MSSNYLQSAIKLFEYYKSLGEKTIAQIPDDCLFQAYNEESNSVAMIVKHLWGNMRSRWTDFLTMDGEKEWRDRETEFQNTHSSREEVMEQWEEGWQCLFAALQALKEEDLTKEVFIRNQGHTVMEAINRQLAHYPYHIGQIVFIGKMYCNAQWQSLSIPRGESATFNAAHFSQPQQRQHFTDEFLNNK